MKKIFLILTLLLFSINCFSQSRYISETTKKIVYTRDGGKCQCCGSSIDEVIVSDSPKGSKKINFIERIARQENVVLYNAVVTLTSITNAPYFDTKIFKAMDKVCQMIYNKHKEKPLN
ncbi:MAG TPA: hypothetical protein PLM70_08965 [Bacteroidales bacterium]|nr:hypothetical protein [Bacteroidales bacterium]